MKAQNEVRAEIEQLSPLLARMKQAECPIEPPEQYFRDMQADVLWRINREAQAGAPKGSISPLSLWAARIGQWLQSLRRPPYAIAFATLTIMIVAAIWILAPRQQTGSNNDRLSALTEDDVLTYIETNYEDFDPGLLVEVLQMNQVWPGTTSGMNDKEAEDFLDAIIKELDVNALQDLL